MIVRVKLFAVAKDLVGSDEVEVKLQDGARIEQLRAELPPGSNATLLALDGDVTARVEEQLTRVRADATHLVVSVGGNDALGFSHITRAPAAPASELFDQLANVQKRFRRDYEKFLVKATDGQQPGFDLHASLGEARRIAGRK